MKRLIVVILLSSIIACACINQSGVYYEKLNVNSIQGVYNPLACYLYSMLLYDDSIYTGSYKMTSTNQEDFITNDIIGEKISTIYSNHGLYVSTNKELLSEISEEATLYKVKGYDPQFRVCIAYETSMPLQETVYHIDIYDHYNDITLQQGNELFQERLHLEESVSVNYLSETNDWCKFDIKFSGFLDELFEGKFIESTDKNINTLATLKDYSLRFEDEYGGMTELKVYNEGYITMESPEKTLFIVKVNKEQCQNIINEMEAKEEKEKKRNII